MSNEGTPPSDLASLRRQVQRLRAAVYTQPDPSANPGLLADLAKAEAALREAESKVTAPQAPAPPSVPEPTPAGRLLGPETTGLKVEPVLNMNPVPTAIYTLLDPETDPLLTVTVTNVSLDAKAKRIRVRAWIEGLSAETVRTVEIKKSKTSPPLKLLPLLFPERARLITEVQRATLHLQVDDLDGKPESHDTFPLVLLARTSGLNAVTDPATGKPKDLTHYYGAWVTPHVEPVQERVRRAAALHPTKMLAGYLHGGPDRVREQVRALYQALRECEIAYINAVTDYGAPPGTVTQRARLPCESLSRKSANCLDGSVLFASLLEGTALSPALLLIPGHALVGWESNDGAGDWQFLESTMIGTHDFDAACASGQKQYQQAQTFYPDAMRLYRIADLRARGIWPME
jgi:hypothetical protein